jgi:RNA polymerase sigma-70 factor (family 1)
MYKKIKTRTGLFLVCQYWIFHVHLMYGMGFMKENKSYDDERILAEMKAGNSLAFDAIYRKYAKSIYGFAYGMLKSYEDAENLVQEVFICLWINRQKIKKGSSLKYYLFTVAYHTSISFLRNKAKDNQFKRRLKVLQDKFQEPADSEIEYKELNTRLTLIINKLPEKQKKVFLLHRREGLTYLEISEKLNISINTVETHMARALKSIKQKLGD